MSRASVPKRASCQDLYLLYKFIKKKRHPKFVGRIRVYYKSFPLRKKVEEQLLKIAYELKHAVDNAKAVLCDPQMEDCEEEREHAMEQLIWEVTDSSVYRLDDFVMERRYGLDVAERIFCAAFIMRQDCRRPPNSMLSDFGSEHLRFAWFSFSFATQSSSLI